MTDISKIFRAYKTLQTMFVDRGYKVSDENLNLSLDDFKKKKLGIDELGGNGYQGAGTGKLDSKYELIAPKEGEDADIIEKQDICVFWVLKDYGPDADSKVSADNVKQVIINTLSTGCNRALMIVRDVTAQCKKEIEIDPAIKVELFFLDDLQVNITEHNLVPKHEVLNEEQKYELLKKYRIKDHQLPKIQSSDPIAKYLGVNRGTVLKITRSSETAGKYVTYRHVI